MDISEFSVDWLPEHPLNFMKMMSEPSERKSKKKTLKLGEPLETISHMPLDSSVSSKSYPSETPSNSNLKQISSSLTQPSSTYTPTEPIIFIPTPSEPHNSNPSSPLLQKFNLTTTTLPIFEALLLNEAISPPSLTPSSPPYYDLSSDSEQPETTDLPSQTLAQLQSITLSNQPPFVPETSVPSPSEPQTKPPSEPPTEPPSEPPTEQPSEPPTETIHTSSESINPSSEPEPTFPTLEKSFALFSESSAVKLRTLSEQSSLSDNPSEVRNH
ncbi:non-classical arabinogalactan protein 31-like [Lathyrus oleraceus]|uniref:non-classical arabinogalactan protein 31-like n=1 Tax=Pisum sativum TaxID=3888 RepID=UPI0021CF4D55|nr:non-classical arabinogalactan protein 31-like [Pisum sativum]